MLHRGVTGETYNVGTDRERTVLDVARDILAAVEPRRAERAARRAAKEAEAAAEAGGGGGEGGEGAAAAAALASPGAARGRAPGIAHVRDRAFNDRRYYIGSDKLAALGWREETGWEEGLRRTIDWYLDTEGIEGYWQGDLESALRPHPVLGAGGALAPADSGCGAMPLPE